MRRVRKAVRTVCGWTAHRIRLLVGAITWRSDVAGCCVCRRPVVELALVASGECVRTYCLGCAVRFRLDLLPHVVLWAPMWRQPLDRVRIRVETVLGDDGPCKCIPAARVAVDEVVATDAAPTKGERS